jgi:signal transduction histidine kinase
MLDRYSRAFFWIFVGVGMLWGWQEQALIDHYISIAFNEIRNLFSLQWFSFSDSPDTLGAILGRLVLIVVFGIVILVVGAVAAGLLGPVLTVAVILYFMGLLPLLVGAIFLYPFYVVFLNLFEFFLLTLIRHPVLADIKYLTYQRELSFGRMATIAAKLMIPIRADTPALASTILGRQLQRAKKLVDAEIGLLRRMREEKIRQALEDMEREERLQPTR